MRRLLTVVAVAVALVAPASASAHSASCGWRTDHQWFYSPTYNEAIYYVGHAVFSGRYWRQFAAHVPAPWNKTVGISFKHYDYVYCG
jgi:hypothetical protein